MKSKKNIEKPDQIVKLSELKGLAKIIAEARLNHVGYYCCKLDGVKTQIVK